MPGITFLSQLSGTVDILGHEVTVVEFDVENLRVLSLKQSKEVYTDLDSSTKSYIKKRMCAYYCLTSRKGNSRINRA